MNWKNGRPKEWYLQRPVRYGTQAEKDIFEAGADAMHKADLEFLREFPDLVRVMQAHMTKQQWLEFVGKGR